MILPVQNKGLQVKRGFKRTVTETDGLHGFATQLLVSEHHAMPGKHRVALQTQIIYRIAKGVCFVLANTTHLVLTCLQVIQHLGLVVELGIYRQRFDRHTYRVEKTLVRTTVINRRKQRLLFIIIFCQQETIGCCEEITLKDTFLFTEGIHLGHLHIERPHQRRLTVLWFLQVGHQLCKAIATVEVLGIPLLTLLKGRCLAQFRLSHRHLCHRHGLGLQCSPTIDLIHIAQHHFQCRTVANDMVDVEEEVEMLCILQQTNMEQSILVNVEGND